mmetsp:Transcript_31037/g.41006  ORF Transcript_31037/g.41006 Transcript_31037/m.41006 type:complete len:893 (-) Transcript_31037:166-2844(-)
MAKKKKNRSSSSFKQAKKVEKKPNPFEVRANSTKKKFEVLNRRVKGENRNVVNARSKAIERRKKTLLIDYKDSKKLNSFVDRRFGENDPTLSLEEKLLVRFQKEKSRRARKGALFRLEEGETGGWGDEEALLTHKGKAIGDDYVPEADEMAPVSDDEGVDAEATGELHFGGGEASRSRQLQREREMGTGEKSRKDVIDEIIAKSKAHKLEKARNREVQEVAVEALDDAFGELQGLLRPSMKPTGTNKYRGPLDEFDTLTRELVYEARAQATDRTKTEEEVAREEKERLEELEKKRLARMKGEFEEDGSDEDAKSKKNKNKITPTDDDLHDEYEIDDRFGLKFSALQEAMTAEGIGVDGVSGEEEGSAEGSDEDEGDEKESSDSSGSDGKESSEEEEQEDQEAVESEPLKTKKIVYRLPGSATEMPYVFECPGSMDQLLALFEKYAESVDDVCTIVDRIIKCHNLKLAAENREKMHNLYDLLLRRFIMVGENLMESPAGSADFQKEMDFLTRTLVALTRQMAEVAGTLWCRLLKTMHRALVKHLRDYSLGLKTTCWPSCGHLLLLQLMGHIFPASDLRHPVFTPGMLFLGQCLAQCAVDSPADLVAGLFCCGLMIDYTSEAKRVVPEVLAFLQGVLAQYTAPPETNVSECVFLPSLAAASLSWLRPSAAKYSKTQLPKIKLSWLGLGEHSVLKKQTLQEISAAALATGYQFCGKYAEILSASQAFPELFQHIQKSLAEMGLLKEPQLPKPLAEAHVSLMEKLEQTSKKCLGTRRPLCWQVVAKKQLKTMAPKFDENYTIRKDKNDDRDKAKIKQLKRQVKRERKGAMRELRRDAEFLEKEKWKETQSKNEAKRQKLRENMSWLEDQTANFNKQVKLGGGLLKGGGSGVKKFKR